MFVGRKEELNILINTYKTKNTHSLVYGNRRVGKTKLITESALRSGLTFISFECLKSTLSNNMNILCEQLSFDGYIPSGVTFNKISEGCTAAINSSD